ncbi:hypothetical protein [Bdellovibrio sp. ArHS]|nr:hypothetical protein [Bdellovibrio sp. ArHS]
MNFWIFESGIGPIHDFCFCSGVHEIITAIVAGGLIQIIDCF